MTRSFSGPGAAHWKIIAAPGFLATLPGAEVVEGLARPPEMQLKHARPILVDPHPIGRRK